MDENSTIQSIDGENILTREIGGCKVRIRFALLPNEKIERLILENLMESFDRKMAPFAHLTGK
jgi:hypothetical protein